MSRKLITLFAAAAASAAMAFTFSALGSQISTPGSGGSHHAVAEDKGPTVSGKSSGSVTLAEDKGPTVGGKDAGVVTLAEDKGPTIIVNP